MERATSSTEKVLAISFVFCAFVAGFLVIHKKEVMAGNLDQVVATYVQDFKADMVE